MDPSFTPALTVIGSIGVAFLTALGGYLVTHRKSKTDALRSFHEAEQEFRDDLMNRLDRVTKLHQQCEDNRLEDTRKHSRELAEMRDENGNLQKRVIKLELALARANIQLNGSGGA